jgi:hypothetical protein
MMSQTTSLVPEGKDNENELQQAVSVDLTSVMRRMCHLEVRVKAIETALGIDSSTAQDSDSPTRPFRTDVEMLELVEMLNSGLRNLYSVLWVLADTIPSHSTEVSSTFSRLFLDMGRYFHSTMLYLYANFHSILTCYADSSSDRQRSTLGPSN